jgi:hypothetical protein
VITMLRRTLAAAALLALLTSVVPAAGAAMACCRGSGESCVCPLTPGFARCDVAPTASSPRARPAILPPESRPFSLAVLFEAPGSPFETLASLALPPLVPPPRF